MVLNATLADVVASSGTHSAAGVVTRPRTHEFPAIVVTRQRALPVGVRRAPGHDPLPAEAGVAATIMRTPIGAHGAGLHIARASALGLLRDAAPRRTNTIASSGEALAGIDDGETAERVVRRILRQH